MVPRLATDAGISQVLRRALLACCAGTGILLVLEHWYYWYLVLCDTSIYGMVRYTSNDGGVLLMLVYFRCAVFDCCP